MKIMLTGATGFVGSFLVPALLSEKNEITVVGRDANKITQLFSNLVKAITWEQLDTLSPDHYDAVINLAGENIGERRWSQQTKDCIIQSRQKATSTIVQWCMKATKKIHLYNTSAIGIYGLQATSESLPPAMTETTKINPVATDFLSEVGHAWEAAAEPMIAAAYPVTLMRFGVVLKRNEGMLKKLGLPFSLGMGMIVGSGQQALSWIHIDDLVKAIQFLLMHPEITGAVNLTAPECVSQKTFAETLAKTMHRPLFLKMPALVVKMMFGQMGEELLLSGQHIYPERLVGLNFKFTYPTLQSALAHDWPR